VCSLEPTLTLKTMAPFVDIVRLAAFLCCVASAQELLAGDATTAVASAAKTNVATMAHIFDNKLRLLKNNKNDKASSKKSSGSTAKKEKKKESKSAKKESKSAKTSKADKKSPSKSEAKKTTKSESKKSKQTKKLSKGKKRPKKMKAIFQQPDPPSSPGGSQDDIPDRDSLPPSPMTQPPTSSSPATFSPVALSPSPVPTAAPVEPTTLPPQPDAAKPPTFSPEAALDCPVEPMLYASSGGGDFFSMFQFCGGSFEATLADTLVEIVVDPTTNRAFAQEGRPVFEFFEFDLLSGSEIPDSRFSTQPVNQFHALEYGGGGKLYGGGWQHLGFSAWNASILYTIDPDAKSFTEVGPTGVRPLSGLAWTGTTMYGVSGAGAPPSELYELNLETGQGTVVCEDLTAPFGSLVYYQPEGLLYGGTSDGNVAQIVPETCEVLNIDTIFAWTAGFRPVTGLTMGCPDP
jgi:hypothetical protein